jgi:hypothetical protein
VTHVRHLWDMTGWRRLSAAELLADIAELNSLWSCVPTVWQTTLEQPTPVQVGDWVVTDTGAPARVELKMNGGYMVMQHRQIAAGGWEATDLDRVAQRDVLPAVVECAHVSAKRQVHWLVGPTHTHFASSRTRARLPKHGSSTLEGLRIDWAGVQAAAAEPTDDDQVSVCGAANGCTAVQPQTAGCGAQD